ncbi:NAD(P)-dependent oxidoreductase [Promicromonospora sp. Populi]|uniref:NAD(P)-dependent oxidoreductase n=1 Tax=Promicromonospora sp. Populi TaxID=3239420 RepID=UPI0034E1F0A8
MSDVPPEAVCIVGAAGRTGAHLVDLALGRGLAVTVVVRDRRRLQRADVEVVEADAARFPIAGGVLRDGMPVISAIAPHGRGPTTAVSDATRNLVRSMEALDNPGRLVITSSRNLVATRPWFFVAPTKFAFRHVYADLTRAEDLVRGSALAWTIARATRLTDNVPRGSVWTDHEPNATGGDWQLPRPDYARALLDLALATSPRHMTIGINGGRPSSAQPR